MVRLFPSAFGPIRSATGFCSSRMEGGQYARSDAGAPKLTRLLPCRGKETAVFAGGCFWGTQAVFERVKGVVATTAGYAGGSASTATYAQVTTETTGTR